MTKFIHFYAFVFFFNFSFSQTNLQNLIDNALVKAKEQDKYIFINFMADACELSEKLFTQIKNETFKPLFEQNYIVLDVVIPEGKATHYFNNLNGCMERKENCESYGFPFWYILDEKGNFIEISYNAAGDNIGYPTTKKKVDDFIAIIKKTSKISDDKLEAMANSFHFENSK